MKISARGVDLIKKYEGLRLEPYKCSGGKLSIGYGHVLDRPHGKISEAKANSLLYADCTYFCNWIDKLVKVPLKQNQLDALVCLVFNIGTNAFAGSTLLKYINDSQPIELVQKEWNKWHHVKGADNAGLVARRKEESELYGL